MFIYSVCRGFDLNGPQIIYFHYILIIEQHNATIRQLCNNYGIVAERVSLKWMSHVPSTYYQTCCPVERPCVQLLLMQTEYNHPF